MSLSFAILLFAGFLLLFSVCLALFGRIEPPLLRSEIVADVVHREKGVDCLSIAIGVDRRVALVECTAGQFFLVFVSGQHLVVRKIRPELVRMADAASDEVIGLDLGDFAAKRREIDLGGRSLAMAWGDKLRRHLTAV